MKSFKRKQSPMAATVEDSGYCPSISVDSKMIPELSDMKVGDEITLTVKCKLVSVNKYRSGEENFSLDVEQGEAETEAENEAEVENETE